MRLTTARILAPLVASMSSPPSFLTAQAAWSAVSSKSTISTVTAMPAGVSMVTWAGNSPFKSALAAANAAAAAQVPVV